MGQRPNSSASRKNWISCAFLIGTAAIALNLFTGVTGLANYKGFTNTRGGEGGEVVRVTNLNAEGPGSLREAVESEGPRIIVFEVGGVIDLEKTTLFIDDPYLTIAGQTAPSPGITIIRGDILIRTHDVIIQHIRVRLGDDIDRDLDAMGTVGSDAHDIIIDHCSISWGIDENLSASGPRTEGPKATSRRVTFSNNIIAEALRDSIHHKGKRAMGSLIHDWCQDIAIIGNLYAHNYHRNPLFKANTTGVIVNNVIYNAGAEAIHLAKVAHQFPPDDPPDSPTVSVVGNILLYGESSREDLPLIYNHPDTESNVYMDDNAAFDRSGNPAPLTNEGINLLDEKPLWPEGFEALSSDQLIKHTLDSVGARPWDRDETDRRVIEHVRRREGRVIDSQEDVGGYPSPEKTRRKLDVPSENVQQWLESFIISQSERGCESR